MPTFKLTLAYDGTGYVGWQRQASGLSIQGLLEDALRGLDGRDVAVAGAGRTDAGVHALGQVASFSLERTMAPHALVRALNARLPQQVRALSAVEMPAAFHARFGARSKAYRYRVWNAGELNPFERQYAWHVVGRLDVGRMDAGARLLEGRHDFAAFQATGGAKGTTERVVSASRITTADTEATVLSSGALILYEICGNGFLRHMVRAIVGTLVEIGRGRHDAEWMREVIASRDRSCAGPTAPAEGLFLVGVEYAEPGPDAVL
jgi:tRNA pseudouridine38-40 synthase